MTAGRGLWRAASVGLTIAALCFVGWKAAEAGIGTLLARLSPTAWVGVGLAAAVYAAALMFVALAWWLLVKSSSSTPLPFRQAFRIYSASHLYKYLPSNMLHYVGRHAALRGIGVTHTAAAVGAIGDIVLLLPASLFVALLASPAMLTGFRNDVAVLGIAAAVVLLLGALALHWAAPLLERWPRTEALATLLRSPRVRMAAIGAFLGYSIFFVVSGAVFATIAGRFGPWQAGDAPLLVAIWAGSWALGFVTPGAPGGIGVREAIITAALSAAGHGESAVLIAILMRVVTLLGDLLFAAIGHLLGIGVQRPQEAALTD